MKEDNQKPELAPASIGERFSEVLAVVAGAPPWIGGPLSQILGGIATNMKVKRLTHFVYAVLEHAEALHSEASEEFVKTEDFVDLFEKTMRAVSEERDDRKRELFGRYMRYNISHPEIEYDQRLECLRALERIDTRHLDLMRALAQVPSVEESRMMLSAPITTIQRRAASVRDQLDDIVHDLNTWRLTKVNTDSLRTNMTGAGAADLRHWITDLGNALLEFLTA